ncbi:NAD-dependent epimerase/dehydratase family protein [Kordiimonas gwangyangensis]|uniref:NAD-dependent epimerase/dehydratase family protein n=1 Tax=Kordiimonas gwangyangensis TaxID=288022 RepID=UPI0004706D9D|nr:NAD(P)H-binding protein [Kordiimonas gwangyangensis]
MNAGSKALVIGATGFIGGAVAECLKQAGYEVWGLCRSASALEKLEQGGLQSLEGEVEQLAVQAKSLSTFDVVVYAASLVGEGAFETECRAIKVILQALALRVVHWFIPVALLFMVTRADSRFRKQPAQTMCILS